MAIKSRSRKGSFLAMIALFTIGIHSLLFAYANGSAYFKNDFFQTEKFQSHVDRFIYYLKIFEVAQLNQEKMKQNIIVTKEEIEEHRYRYGNLPEQLESIHGQYEQKIAAALAEGKESVANAYIAERDAKMEDITKNFESDEHVRVKIVREKEKIIEDFFQQLEQERSWFLQYKNVFSYDVIDVETGKQFTYGMDKDLAYVQNVPGERLDELPTMSFPTEISLPEILPVVEGTIGVKKAALSNAMFAEYREFTQKQIFYYSYVVAGILALIASIVLYRKVGIPFEESNVYYDKVPIDVRVILTGFTGIITLFFLVTSTYIYTSLAHWLEEMVFILLFASLFMGVTAVQLKFLYDSLRHEEQLKKDIAQSVSYKFANIARELFLSRSIGLQTTLLLAIVFAFGAGAVFVFFGFEFILLYVPAAFIVLLPVVALLLSRIAYFNRIAYHVEQLVNGNLEEDLPIRGKSMLAQFAQNINKLKQGVKASKIEQAKSERLKTELITNVSHDLRTPLTSIMTYAELLQSKDATEDERAAYIEIINRKSKRLKILIDDLFEASKMASGNMELYKAKVDLVQLLEQSLAEYDDEIKQSTLQFRIAKPQESVYVYVDGQKMWRVFDNLINNILKYSLEATRVYISIKEIERHVIVTFKNVTKYELGENIEEMFERFKRGDKSRHTDGSGLGLAIAKSIVDLHAEQMDIDVDGDLFKVTIRLTKIS